MTDLALAVRWGYWGVGGGFMSRLGGVDDVSAWATHAKLGWAMWCQHCEHFQKSRFTSRMLHICGSD